MSKIEGLFEGQAFFLTCFTIHRVILVLSIYLHELTGMNIFNMTYLFVALSVLSFVTRHYIVNNKYAEFKEGFRLLMKKKAIILNIIGACFYISCYHLIPKSHSSYVVESWKNSNVLKDYLIAFATTLGFDMVTYPWHHLQHKLMGRKRTNPHYEHHVDEKFNLFEGLCHSLADIYPVYIYFPLFVIYGDAYTYLIYCNMYLLLFAFEHCYEEGFPFVKFHYLHHRKKNCNYADFHPIMDMIFGTYHSG